MANWNTSVKIPLPADYNFPLLQKEVAVKFGAAYVDCSITDFGAALEVYLYDPQLPVEPDPETGKLDEAYIGIEAGAAANELADVIQAHDPANAPADEKQVALDYLAGLDKSKLDPALAAIITALGL